MGFIKRLTQAANDYSLWLNMKIGKQVVKSIDKKYGDKKDDEEIERKDVEESEE